MVGGGHDLGEGGGGGGSCLAMGLQARKRVIGSESDWHRVGLSVLEALRLDLWLLLVFFWEPVGSGYGLFFLFG